MKNKFMLDLVALRDNGGLISAILDNLSGKQKEEWKKAFSFCLRKKSYWNTPKELLDVLNNLSNEEITGLVAKTHKVVQVMFPLPSLVQDTAVRELVQKTYIYDFYDRADVKMVKATGVTLQMPKPAKLGKVTTERDILQENFPQLRGLDDDVLIIEVKKIFPTREKLQSSMMQAIIESEEGRADTVSTKTGTWTLGFCIDDDGMPCTFRCSRNFDGWDVGCRPVELGDQWSAGRLLYLATES